MISRPLRTGGIALLLALSAACSPFRGSREPGACLDGGQACAAAAVPVGSRAVLRGHRLVRWQWRQGPNRESGVPDVGLQAEWAPVLERR